MILTDSKLIEIFCDCDDFCNFFEQWQQSIMIESRAQRKGNQRVRKDQSLSESMCIMM